jgi:hypothetical protein
MSVGLGSDFKIYNEQFFGGVIETLQQNADGFNAASNGGIRLVTQLHKGNWEQESFFKSISALVSRRDITSVSGATDTPLQQGELVRIKLNRKIGPVAQTLDAFRKISMDPAEMSFVLGQQTGVAIALDYLNTGLLALDAATSGQSALCYDASSNTSPDRSTLDHTNLVRTMAKLGDASNRIVAWVMHSKPFFDLMENTIADKIFEVANVVVYGGTPATFGRPVVVTDSASLITVGSSSTTYHIHGLTDNAAVVEESEERQIASMMITGLENLVMRVQGEYAFNIGVKGFAWDTNGGGTNPTNSSVGTSGNWLKAATDVKNLASVRLTTL